MMRALTAIARRIVREETFESLVAPALADLQFDAASGRPLARHYAALPLVIATALLRDLRIDIRLTVGAPRVWKRAAAWYAGFVTLYISVVVRYEMPWHLLDLSGRSAVLANGVASGLVAAVPYAMAAVAFYLRRGSPVPHRTIVAAVSGFIVGATALQLAVASVQPAVNKVVLDSATRVVEQGHPGAGLDDRSRYTRQWRTWLERVRERSSGSEILADGLGSAMAGLAFSYAVKLIPFVIYGLILARGRGWTVSFRAVGLLVTYFAVGMLALLLTIRLYGPSSPNYQAGRELIASYVTGLMWLLGIRILLLPLLPVYALTQARRLFSRSTSLPD
jgi:hypothetical protein